MKQRPNMWRFKGEYWQYQLLGWSFFLFNEMYGGWKSLTFSPIFLFQFLSTYGTLFGILEVARIFYRKIFQQIKDPAFYLVIAAIASFICSFFWRETRTIIDVLIFHTKDSWLGAVRDNTYLVGILYGTYVPFIWSILYFGIKYYQRMVLEKKRANEALLLAQKAQLQMLRYQLNPHFLFNSLNSVQALVHENPDKADDMVSELSEFLRYTLKYSDSISVSVHDEIGIISKYLSIEKVRFEERLDYFINVDAQLLNMEIPCLILQPLVENAIKHGLMNNPGGIRLGIVITVENSELVLEVSNTGTLKEGWKKGIGLENVVDRLSNSFPEKSNFELYEKEGVVFARISIKM
ncbi:MAG: histidine kinase [Bacteroidales bacterium]|nr:histidine kinase [Bacteroidales bacterium]